MKTSVVILECDESLIEPNQYETIKAEVDAAFANSVAQPVLLPLGVVYRETVQITIGQYATLAANAADLTNTHTRTQAHASAKTVRLHAQAQAHEGK